MLILSEKGEGYSIVGKENTMICSFQIQIRLEATLIDPETLALEWLNCPMFHLPLQCNSLVGEGGI